MNDLGTENFCSEIYKQLEISTICDESIDGIVTVHKRMILQSSKISCEISASKPMALW